MKLAHRIEGDEYYHESWLSARTLARSWESFASASSPPRCTIVGEERRRPSLGSFQTPRWTCRCAQRGIGAQSRLLWTGVRCAVITTLRIHDKSDNLMSARRAFQPRPHYYLSRSFGFSQANYQFSHYVAEISNTFSNLLFVCISLYGARLSSRESLPTRCLVGFAVRPATRHFFCSLLNFC